MGDEESGVESREEVGGGGLLEGGEGEEEPEGAKGLLRPACLSSRTGF